MSDRNRVETRAQMIYAFLDAHRGEGFTLAQLCGALGIQPGTTTTAAIRRARAIATDHGVHFPTAVPANGHTYRVTASALDAIDPTAHQARIRQGVARREQDGIDFLRAQRKHLHGAERRRADAVVAFHALDTAVQEARAAAEALAADFVRQRREERVEAAAATEE